MLIVSSWKIKCLVIISKILRKFGFKLFIKFSSNLKNQKTKLNIHKVIRNYGKENVVKSLIVRI